jgi:transglutaminase-like putative cysteine protease
MGVRYQITHRTTYRYQTEVTGSYGKLTLFPRDFTGQRCESNRVVIDPRPDDYREHDDYYGNRTAFFAIATPHRTLEVTSTSIVAVDRGDALAGRDDVPWEAARLGPGTGRRAEPLDEATVEACEFTLDSPLVGLSEDLADYARVSFTPGRAALEALADLGSRIHRDFTYETGVTTTTTQATEALARRRGVCQDFAHVAIGCLRSLGLAARYASGYIETDPPPGQARLAGADASHAWASLFLPTGGRWVGVDPTNEQFVGDRYVTVAWGRDYTDIPPLKGVIFTEGTDHELSVDVDVVALGPAGPG